MKIRENLLKNKKEKPDFSNLVFGKNFSDHMFVMKYEEEKGWYDASIEPYAPITISPGAIVFHYGQETFEGLKAYKDENGKISLFRPMDNFKRMNKSNERLCMPTFDEKFVLEALKRLLIIEKDWIPTDFGTSLYIRPLMIATEEALGVKTSSEYTFFIILSPVASYYKNGIAPTSIYVEDFYVRASEGGTGEAKCGGNYAASIKPYIEAKKKGYDQVLFLDGSEHRYIEEVGTSNAFFVIDGTVVTPPLKGTILPGITRDSMIKVLKDKNIPVEERKITVDELFKAYDDGKLNEAFASGTAAVISPIGKLSYKDKDAIINNGEIGEISQLLYDSLTDIQYKKSEDKFNWLMKVE